MKHMRRSMKTASLVSITLFLACFAGFAPLLSGFINPMAPAQGMACTSNLKQIVMGLRLYAESNNGKFPEGDTETIVKTMKDSGILRSTQIWRCPGRPKSEKVPPSSYTVISGLNTSLSAGMPLVLDKPGNHSGSINAGFVDGSTKTFKTDSKNYTGLLPLFTGISASEKALLKAAFEKLDGKKTGKE